MAALPSPTQVAGINSAIFEAYYNHVDPKGHGTVGAMEAARFLKKSGLSDVILSRIWDLSDPGGRGCLDKTGMFVALKLVSLAQAGRDINMSNINLDMPAPKMGDVPLPKPKKPPLPSHTPLITSLPASAVDWSVKPSEKDKYDKLFDSLQPINGLIPGNKVKGVLMDSKLPLETLGKIWDLADQDKDGMLDRPEFVAAMHLVYKALEKHAIPNVLPAELMPPTKRKGNVTPMMGAPLIAGLDGMRPKMPPPMTSIPPMSHAQPPPQPITTQPLHSTPPMIPSNMSGGAQPAPPRPVQSVQPQPQPWVVTGEEKAKSDALFIKSDVDKDGFVSGFEIKDVFLQSGVPQQILAHIWALCDINQSGKLNNEQFALSMWFVARCLKGINPPATLTPEMIPPTFRTSKPSDGPVENNNTCYSNPELEMISKDIQELAKEKYALETDIAQKEADIKIKSGEIKSLQSELDTLAATLKQLENQKGEAMKRLGDLKAQKTSVDKEMEEVQVHLNAQNTKVEKLRAQAAEQADVISSQEAELMSKKEQLEGLKMEEQRLEQLKIENTRKLDGLSNNLQSTQLTISQAKAMISQLEEQSRQMNDAIAACDSAIETNDANAVPDNALRINPDFRDSEYSRIGMVNGNSQQNGFGDQSDPFTSQNGHGNPTTFNNDPFANDPFKGSNDAFTASDPFNNQTSFSANANDDFQSSDPFNNFGSKTTKADPYNAFGDSKNTSVTPEPNKDPFGCDPFAVLHAPTRDGVSPGRPVSPSPALPPKKAKPPRPAPPRPIAPPTFNKPDPFAAPSSGGGGGDPFGASGPGGFADFADFDTKFSDNPNATAPTTTTTTPPNKQAPPSNNNNKVGLDFTDDPFRDYRYEDPFNIAFDEDDDTTTTNEVKSIDTFDPFGLSGRQSVPLPTPTNQLNEAGFSVSNHMSGRLSAPPTSRNKLLLSSSLINNNRVSSGQDDHNQLAWAAMESLRFEETRKQRQLQEQADLALAIALSKADNNNKL